MQYAPVPSWQNTELQKLAAEGQLSGVPPELLSVIDLAESSGSGGGVNSSGYGGFFGLGANTQYPTGHTSSQMLAGTDPGSFDQQAIIAAGEFASLLESNHLDPLAAERAYQGGGSEGTSLFQRYGIAGPIDASVNPNSAAFLTGSSNGTSPSTKIAQLGPFSLSTPYGLLSRAVLMLVGVFLVYLGVKQLSSTDNNAIDTVVIGTKQAGRTMKGHAQKAATLGAEGAAA